MFVDFNDISPSARIWIYQCDRKFSEEELLRIKTKLNAFTDNWKAHGSELRASYTIKYDQFIIIAVDEGLNSASGCSIDASVHTIQELEHELQLELMDKMKVSFKDGENINTVTMQQFKEFAKQNKINSNTLVFNNMVSSKEAFESSWEIEAGQSWHARFLN